VLVHHLQAKRGNGCGCNNPEMVQAFFPNQSRSRITPGQETRDEWSDQVFNDGMRVGHIDASLDNIQLGHHRLI